MSARISPLDVIFDSHVPNDAVERIVPYAARRPPAGTLVGLQARLALLQVEMLDLRRDFIEFVESPLGWHEPDDPIIYAGDEEPV